MLRLDLHLMPIQEQYVLFYYEKEIFFLSLTVAVAESFEMLGCSFYGPHVSNCLGLHLTPIQEQYVLFYYEKEIFFNP